MGGRPRPGAPRGRCERQRRRFFRRGGRPRAPDCLVTGEAGHHDALDALAAGVTLIAATHFATETAIAGVLAHRIAEAFPGLRVQRSVADADPFLYF